MIFPWKIILVSLVLLGFLAFELSIEYFAAAFLILFLLIFQVVRELRKSGDKPLDKSVSEINYSAIIENLGDGVIVYSSDFRVVVFNKATEDILKLKRE